jgi:hypothetical protein
MKPLKKICHHVNNKIGHPTPIDKKNTNKGNVVAKDANILFYWGHLGI